MASTVGRRPARGTGVSPRLRLGSAGCPSAGGPARGPGGGAARISCGVVRHRPERSRTMQSTPSPFPTRLELRGAGLVLRDWTEDDVPAMPGLLDHPHLASWTPPLRPRDEAGP